MSVLVAVTDHAVERFRQRIGGSLDARAEIVRRVARAWDAGRVSEEPPLGATGARGSVYVRDLVDRSLVFVCRREGTEVVVITLWEQPGGVAPPRVDRIWTDALRDRGR
ncbi:MAG: hypothetical protein ACXVFK_07720 [Solirubrobacteraceae bacterium]